MAGGFGISYPVEKREDDIDFPRVMEKREWKGEPAAGEKEDGAAPLGWEDVPY
jgi:hypothetical protein